MKRIDYSPLDQAEKDAYAAYRAEFEKIEAEYLIARGRFDTDNARAYDRYRAFVRKHRKEIGK